LKSKISKPVVQRDNGDPKILFAQPPGSGIGKEISTSVMPLTLSRVISEDFNTLLPIQFAAFANNGAHNAQLGFNTPDNIAHAKKFFLEDFASDSADVWLKVTDDDANGRIVAASNWKIYPTYVKKDFDAKAAASEKLRPEDVTWHSDARQKEEATTILKEFFAIRYRTTREAHICKSVPFNPPPCNFPDLRSA
jgi:hypothetical protein